MYKNNKTNKNRNRNRNKIYKMYGGYVTRKIASTRTDIYINIVGTYLSLVNLKIVNKTSPIGIGQDEYKKKIMEKSFGDKTADSVGFFKNFYVALSGIYIPRKGFHTIPSAHIGGTSPYGFETPTLNKDEKNDKINVTIPYPVAVVPDDNSSYYGFSPKTDINSSYYGFSHKTDINSSYYGFSPNTDINKNIVNKKKWVKCYDNKSNKCYTLCHNYVEKEIKSTAYMLRIIASSVIGIGNVSETLQIEISRSDFDNLTGIWANDSDKFKLSWNVPLPPTSARLIMGFGPSASGKTHCAKKVIELMTSVKPDFPTVFITVDGGIFREQSQIYQAIINTVIASADAKGNHLAGIINLVPEDALTANGIFKAGEIKKPFKKFLLAQMIRGFKASLYVPETLGWCGALGKGDCIGKYKDYIKITGDNNWIGLMIYQDETHSKCPYKKEYECKGTTESGKDREMTEGKKYSSVAWGNSYENGITSIKTAPTYRFIIHNSGRIGIRSIINDLTNPPIMDDSSVNVIKLQKTLDTAGWDYIRGNILGNPNNCMKMKEGADGCKTLNKTKSIKNGIKLKKTLDTSGWDYIRRNILGNPNNCMKEGADGCKTLNKTKSIKNKSIKKSIKINQ